MHLLKEIEAILPSLLKLEILIPYYVNFEEYTISIPTLQCFLIESKGEGNHALTFEK